METEKLIDALAADAGRPSLSLDSKWLIAVGMAIAAVSLIFFVFLGPRTDIAQAAQTLRFVLKPALAIVLFATAVSALAVVMRPAARLGARGYALALAPAMLVAAAVAELFLLPRELWMPRLVGTNAVLCMTVMPALSIGPLLALLWALRQGAPMHPNRAGALAGVAAAGLGATFYALNCTDDSPLFVATWYPLATAVVVVAGAVIGRRWLSW